MANFFAYSLFILIALQGLETTANYSENVYAPAENELAVGGNKDHLFDRKRIPSPTDHDQDVAADAVVFESGVFSPTNPSRFFPSQPSQAATLLKPIRGPPADLLA